MSSKNNFHPEPKLLEAFVKGELNTGLSVAISAHLEMCESSRQAANAIEAEISSQWAEESVANSIEFGTELDSLMEAITATAQVKEESLQTPGNNKVAIEWDTGTREVELPSVLAKIASEGLEWKRVAGGISEASVILDDKTQCEFLHMKPGSQVPLHKHQGTEVTLVLDGSFSDDFGEYKPSDFLLRTNKDTHQPRTEEGCLCFAVLDSPLTFTSGLARLLNPFLRYRFRRATSSSI